MPEHEYEWQLDGKVKRQKAPPVRQCPACFTAFVPAKKCPACAYVFPVELTPRQAARQKAGELAELQQSDPDTWMKTAPYKDVLKSAKSLEALKQIAKARGYDHRWAGRMWAMKSGGYRPMKASA